MCWRLATTATTQLLKTDAFGVLVVAVALINKRNHAFHHVDIIKVYNSLTFCLR